MQPNARWQAVLELITSIWQDQTPADKIINEYFRARRYIGSGDRRFISEQIWQLIRNRCKLEFDATSTEPRHILLAHLRDQSPKVFTGEPYAPSKLSQEEQTLLHKILQDETPYPNHIEAETPKWLYDKIKNDSLCKSLNQSAPADFRINVKHREDVQEKLNNEGFDLAPTSYSPLGLRSQQRINLNNCMAYQEGEIDVQDEGSQLVSILANPQKQEKIIDYCAGAGGKTLTMSYLLHNQGCIEAHDINWSRLEAIKDRSDRLKVNNIKIIKDLKDHDYDLFLLDAPCSGTGTWRRSPDAKFRLTETELKRLTNIQADLLHLAAVHTTLRGRIVYITCSVLKDENDEQIRKFLARHPEFEKLNIKELWQNKFTQPYPNQDEYMLHLSPLSTNTDGFFICILQKNA